jgi:hypothetical protein
MQRLHAVHHFQHPIHQRLPFPVVQFPQRPSASQMCVVIRIASRASQRTFPRNLDRKGRVLALQNLPPRLHYLMDVHRYRPPALYFSTQAAFVCVLQIFFNRGVGRRLYIRCCILTSSNYNIRISVRPRQIKNSPLSRCVIRLATGSFEPNRNNMSNFPFRHLASRKLASQLFVLDTLRAPRHYSTLF